MANSIYNCGCGQNASPAADEPVSCSGCGCNTCGNTCNSCGNSSLFGGENDLLTLIATVLLVVSLLWGR